MTRIYITIDRDGLNHHEIIRVDGHGSVIPDRAADKCICITYESGVNFIIYNAKSLPRIVGTQHFDDGTNGVNFENFNTHLDLYDAAVILATYWGGSSSDVTTV